MKFSTCKSEILILYGIFDRQDEHPAVHLKIHCPLVFPCRTFDIGKPDPMGLPVLLDGFRKLMLPFLYQPSVETILYL